MAATSTSYKPEYSIPIAERYPRTWLQTLKGLAFFLAILVGSSMINGAQIIFLAPLLLLPFPWAKDAYVEGVRYTKGSFACFLILATQVFAPTHLLITFEREGQGRFTEQEISEIVERNSSGEVVALRLPKKSVMISNHQVYVDWLYAWCLTYFMNTHKDVFIVLKRSLKWVPIAGWGMQFYDFIFLARSWAADKLQLSRHLSRIGRMAENTDKPLTLMLYPEGTLVSKDTRPISKKFADKRGMPDMVHTLLPRSTGLHYSLRSLAPRIPSLRLIDITMVYPGIPRLAYGQSYYTLRSIFFNGIPPPAIHIHLRSFSVSQEVPIGDLTSTNPGALPNGNGNGNGNGADATSHGAVTTTATALEVDPPEEEREKFDDWLRELWREKDAMIERYYETGSLAGPSPSSSGRQQQQKTAAAAREPLKVPLRLRHKIEVFDAFCFFAPGVVVYHLWARFFSG